MAPVARCVCYHDLSGSLAHTQLGLNLYKYPKSDAAPAGLAHLAFRVRRFFRRRFGRVFVGGVIRPR